MLLLAKDCNIFAVNATGESIALATAFNVIGYPDAIKYANNNNIALMLVVDIDGGAELIFSNKWYDLNL